MWNISPESDPMWLTTQVSGHPVKHNAKHSVQESDQRAVIIFIMKHKPKYLVKYQSKVACIDTDYQIILLLPRIHWDEAAKKLMSNRLSQQLSCYGSLINDLLAM